MSISNKTLKKLLVEGDYITETKFNDIKAKAKKRDIKVVEELYKSGTIEKEKLGDIIAEEKGVLFVDLESRNIDPNLFRIVPEAVSRAQNCVIFEEEDSELKLATSNPVNYEFINLLEKKTGQEVKVYYAFEDDVVKKLRHYGTSFKKQLEGIVEKFKENPGNEDLIVELTDKILEYAYDSEASDIHLEPLSNRVSVRIRVDGILHEIFSYTTDIHSKIALRVKIMAGLRTDESNAAQDGRFEYKIEDTKFDVRVSVLPVTDGENIVMRLLSTEARRFNLGELGLRDKDRKKLEKAMNQPNGMILTVGPSGAGKTTTLYAVLQALNKPEVNIMTIEDPVEYDIDHVQQTQTNPKKDLTFSTGLRSIVRQDPDIIMVGEIRDEETADIAVNSAMTGHLLLSTLHANDAATTFPRLAEMKIQPFLISSSVNIVISQRLVRKICNHCKSSKKIDEDDKDLLESNPKVKELLLEAAGKENIDDIEIYEGTGEIKEADGDKKVCGACNGLGYKSRVGIFEVLEMDEEIKSLINDKASSDVIREKALEKGMDSLMEDGVVKVITGDTTIKEIIRVTKS